MIKMRAHVPGWRLPIGKDDGMNQIPQDIWLFHQTNLSHPYRMNALQGVGEQNDLYSIWSKDPLLSHYATRDENIECVGRQPRSLQSCHVTPIPLPYVVVDCSVGGFSLYPCCSV